MKVRQQKRCDMLWAIQHIEVMLKYHDNLFSSLDKLPPSIWSRIFKGLSRFLVKKRFIATEIFLSTNILPQHTGDCTLSLNSKIYSSIEH
jgi:hypothetical protein